jgi:hypothetical protein
MSSSWKYRAGDDRRPTREQLYSHPEVRRWLGNLGTPKVHGSKDTCAENAMAKLVAFGLRAGDDELDAKMLPYARRVEAHDRWFHHNSDPAAPFLIAAGYGNHPNVRNWFEHRLAALHLTATLGTYDIYLTAEKARRVPRAWRGKRIHKPEYVTGPARLPSCYDLVALAHWVPSSRQQRSQIGTVAAYVFDPRFQRTPGGYFWDARTKRCYAAGRGWLACFTPQRRLIFLELAVRFAEARAQPWFRAAMKRLARTQVAPGRYRFPLDDLRETRNSYYLYTGSHMGLGEDRRNRAWRDVESTFWMLHLDHLGGGAAS